MIPFISSKRQLVIWSGIFFVTLILTILGCSASKEKSASAGEQGLRSGSDPKKTGGDPSISKTGAAKGRELFDSIGCMGCHMVNGKGGMVGPDLSDEADKGKSRKWLTTQIRDPKANDPTTIMPAFDNLSDKKVDYLVDYLMTLSSKKHSHNTKPVKTQKTNESGQASSGSDSISLSVAGEKWSDICGRCHNLRAPSEFSDAQWAVAVDHMRLIVPLTSQEQREVLEFLKANN
jgi:mono/diheme cytochrome c family protein